MGGRKPGSPGHDLLPLDRQSMLYLERIQGSGRRPSGNDRDPAHWLGPLGQTIRSWVFDSEGGFGEGIWTREGNQWIVKKTGVTRDGKVASATNIITRVSKDRMTWQQRDGIVGGEKTPDIAETPITGHPLK